MNLPSMATLLRNVCCYHHERNLPGNPIDCEAISELTYEYQVIASVEQFLSYNSDVANQERVFISCSTQGLKLLANSEHWYGDKTFKICPTIYCQLYTANAQRDSRIFPCALALLPNK